MKRTTMLFAAMAALTLASCSKNEVADGSIPSNDPTKISFNSSTGTTRAVANALEQVKGGFTVVGQDKANAKFIVGDQATSTYEYADGKWSWNNEAGKEWPEASSFPLTFYAAYPLKDLTGDLTEDVNIALDMSTQEDLLVAKSVVATRPTNGFAPLDFKHILSNLVFKIQTRENYKVYVQSIRVVNTAKEGRKFDYATMAYETVEPTYIASNLASTDGKYFASEGFFYSRTMWSFEGAAGAEIGTVPAASGIMMQMPQMNINYWTADNTTNGLGAFQKDALAWKEGTETGYAEKLAAWTAAETTAVGQPGMKGSKGWEGARIEVIYRIYDVVGDKSIVGRETNEQTETDGGSGPAAQDYFVRVGYPLDLSAIKDVADASKGWEMNKRYTYTIQLGTPGATNGILLDPSYVSNDGSTPTPAVKVDNPKDVTPGNPVTPGLINFDVAVSDWIDNAGGTDIL